MFDDELQMVAAAVRQLAAGNLPKFGWQQHATCATLTPAANSHPSTWPIEDHCSGCPVATECLTDALTSNPSHDVGVRGGVGVEQRQQIRQACQQHGLLQTSRTSARTRGTAEDVLNDLLQPADNTTNSSVTAEIGENLQEPAAEGAPTPLIDTSQLKAGRWVRLHRQIPAAHVRHLQERQQVGTKNGPCDVLVRTRADGTCDVLAHLNPSEDTTSSASPASNPASEVGMSEVA